LDLKIVEQSAYKLNLLLSDKKAKKIDSVKKKIVDYDLFDLEKGLVNELIERNMLQERRDQLLVKNYDEEATRKRIAHEG
jgi:hypothetical protein